MSYQSEEVQAAANTLMEEYQALEEKRAILRSPTLSSLYERLKTLPAGEERAKFGQDVNVLKNELEAMVRSASTIEIDRAPIDVTAPMDVNSAMPTLLGADNGSIHPLMREMDEIVKIFAGMGFSSVESREIDDDYHMFTSLNFPPDHPARDEYDTFTTDEGLFAPAHTSIMQNRVLKDNKDALEKGQAIAAVIPGRVFRNEDVDARHEHTFYQLEGVYVDKGINAGHLAATIRAWLSTYFGRDLNIKIQPFYFPFTEPSFEFAAGCPFCDPGASHLDAVQGDSDEQTSRTSATVSEREIVNDAAMRQKAAGAPSSAGWQGEVVRGGGKGCSICSHTGWIELGGCGMIHPNVLKEGGIDPAIYTGFAWGFGIDRLVMLKYDIEDVRHFESGNLKFLRQF